MSKAKAQSKTARKSAMAGVQKVDDPAASKLVILSDGHRVSHFLTGKTDCGEYMVGWRYGVAEDVLCGLCRESEDAAG